MASTIIRGTGSQILSVNAAPSKLAPVSPGQDPMKPVKQLYARLLAAYVEPVFPHVSTRWNAMDADARRKLLKKVAPEAPESPEKPYCIVNGEQVDLRPLVAVCPEICVSTLIAGETIEFLTDHMCKYNSFSQAAMQQVKVIRYNIQRGILMLTETENLDLDKYVLVYNDGVFGKAFQMGPEMEKKDRDELDAGVRAGLMVHPHEFEMVMHRLQLLLGVCFDVIAELASDDEAATAVIKAAKDVEVWSRGCWSCGKNDTDNTFMKCAKCVEAQYCSKDCQVQDWRVGGHKKRCGK